MKTTIGQATLELTIGDITESTVDAIVNAANSRLAGGGGVDGAIHRRGGPSIMAETRQRYPEGCATGSAVISTAGELPTRFVIHAVGPVWSGGVRQEAEQLAAAYCSALQLAANHGCRSGALPALSKGAYRFPLDQASRLALRTACDFLHDNQKIQLVRFVLFSEGVYGAFAMALEEILA